MNHVKLQEHKTTKERYAVKRVSREKFKDVSGNLWKLLGTS